MAHAKVSETCEEPEIFIGFVEHVEPPQSSSSQGESKIGRGGLPYTITSSGTNSQGNHYCKRDYGSGVSNQNSYHYSNSDGSYYYSNPDSSTYHNDGKGSSYYTAPDGTSYSKGN